MLKLLLSLICLLVCFAVFVRASIAPSASELIGPCAFFGAIVWSAILGIQLADFQDRLP